MSDSSKRVTCPKHGESFATFVCQHLQRGQGTGFFCADDPTDAHPDAWCDGCEMLMRAEGGWNDRSEAFAQVTMICAGCYDDTRRQRHQDSTPAPVLRVRCSTCGKEHDLAETSFGADAPAQWSQLNDQERVRSKLSSDLCVIDADDGKHRFIRACLEIPIRGTNQKYSWGVWVSLSEKSFDEVEEHWEDPQRVNLGPYFGWLCTPIPNYPDTMFLKTKVHPRPVGLRPLIELEPTDHPLAVQQRSGVDPEELREMLLKLLHPV